MDLSHIASRIAILMKPPEHPDDLEEGEYQIWEVSPEPGGSEERFRMIFKYKGRLFEAFSHDPDSWNPNDIDLVSGEEASGTDRKSVV